MLFHSFSKDTKPNLTHIVVGLLFVLVQPWFDEVVASPINKAKPETYPVRVPANQATAITPDTLFVTTTADWGKGSLREAIIQANAHPDPHIIRFDTKKGPFATPQTIRLRNTLPELRGELIIDGSIDNRLWQATGITLSGENKHPVLRVAPNAKIILSAFSVANGYGQHGGGIVNRGRLLLKGMTFRNNDAKQDGGGLISFGGIVTIINSTFVDNRAGEVGGGLANNGGNVTVTHGTFSANSAPKGGGLFSHGTLLLRNTILANSREGKDCTSLETIDPASTHNLIESNEGCGHPISTADPRLETLGFYNGPTPTLPLGGGSPAINMGNNAAAVDEYGELLAWDQRGNGDPRFVAGFADIGAFEVQAFPVLRVNTAEDNEMRACTGGETADCSLRGAITLANAMGKPAMISFSPQTFATSKTTIHLTHPLPEAEVELTFDARKTSGVTVQSTSVTFHITSDRIMTFRELNLESPK